MKKISDKKLAKLGGKMPFSTIASPRKAVRKSNPIATAKRKAGYRKMLSGKEYRAAKAEAMVRAEDRCEYVTDVRHAVASIHFQVRCWGNETLHAHHLRYPKTRALKSSDLLIVCKYHHEYLESQKPHKSRMF